MPAKKFFIKDATASGSGYGSLSETDQLGVVTTTGWNKSALNFPPSSALMGYGGAGTDNFTSSANKPAQSPGVGHTEGFRTESPYNLTFAAGVWSVDVQLKFPNSCSAAGIEINCQLWKGSDANLATSTQLTAGTQRLSNVSAPGTNAIRSSNGTFSLGQITFNNEYLLIMIALRAEGSSDFCSELIMTGTGTTSCIITPALVPGQIFFKNDRKISLGEGGPISNGINRIVSIG